MRSQLRHKTLLLFGFIVLPFVLLAGALQGSAQDVIVHLNNGDRISGHILSEDEKELILSTPFAPRISVIKTFIRLRETAPARKTASATSTNTVLETTPPPRPATGIVSELSTNKGEALPEKTKQAATKPAEPSLFKKLLSEWHGEAQLGANLGFGNKEREAFTGHLKMTETHPFPGTPRSLRNIFDYDIAYSTTDHVLSDNRMEGTWKSEYDISRRFLVYNAASAGYDEIRKIDFQFDVGPGLGYKWVVLTNFVFKNEIGGDYQEQYFAQKRTSSRYSLRLEEDLWWQITPKLRWDEKIELFPELQDFSQYRVRLETNLSYLLKQNLTVSLNVVDQYDTALPPGVSKNDLQIRSLVGLKF